MRCYCHGLRGDLGIILLRKVISVSFLFVPGIPALRPSSGTRSDRPQWLAAGRTLATGSEGQQGLRDLLNPGVLRGSLALQFLTSSTGSSVAHQGMRTRIPSH